MDARELFRLARSLHSLAIELTADEARGAEGPTASEIAVTEDLTRHPGSAIGAVAERTRFSQGAVSKVVASLVEAGFATTAPDPADRRRTQVTLSPTLVESMRARGTRPLNPALTSRGLSPTAAARAEELLDELALLLQEHPSRAGEASEHVRGTS